MGSTTVSFFSSLSFEQLPIELVFIAGVWFLLAVFGFTTGIFRLDAIGLTVMTVVFSSEHLSSTWVLESMLGGAESSPILTLLIAGGLAVVLYLIFSKLCDPGFSDGGDMTSAALSALAVTALVTLAWATAFTFLWSLPELLSPLFAPAYFLWWIFGSLTVLTIMRGRRLWK